MTEKIPGWDNINVKGYDPGKRKRCVNVAWRPGRNVRILAEGHEHKGRLGTIINVGEQYVYVRVKMGRKPGQWEEWAYLPNQVRLT